MSLRNKFRKGIPLPSSNKVEVPTESTSSEIAGEQESAPQSPATLDAAASLSTEQAADTNAAGQNEAKPAASQTPPAKAANPPKLKLGAVLDRAKAMSNQAMADAKKKAEQPIVKKLPTAATKVLTPAAPTAMQRMKKLQEANAVITSVFPDTPPEETQFDDFDAEGHLNDLKALELSLIEDVPQLPVLMGRVMRNLQKYEDLAHILTEPQIQVVVEAFAKRKGIEVVVPTKGTGKAAGRSVATLTKDLTPEQILNAL